MKENQGADKKYIKFLGVMRLREDVLSYYEMIRDAYMDYVTHKCEYMTDAKRLYVKTFKARVDSLANDLGLSARMPKPDNFAPKKKRKKKGK